jgi:16S rRNA (guanine966-N2)-methyltransferase
LELFAGTGAFGFEALSRGAQFVVFVDKDRRAINLVKQTVRMLAVQQHVCALNMTWSAAVTHLAGRNEQFQMIFLDPPYGEQWIPQVLCRHDFSDLVALDGVVIVERAVQLQDYRVPVGFERRFHKRYGNTVVEILYRRPGDA